MSPSLAILTLADLSGLSLLDICILLTFMVLAGLPGLSLQLCDLRDLRDSGAPGGSPDLVLNPSLSTYRCSALNPVFLFSNSKI